MLTIVILLLCLKLLSPLRPKEIAAKLPDTFQDIPHRPGKFISAIALSISSRGTSPFHMR